MSFYIYVVVFLNPIWFFSEQPLNSLWNLTYKKLKPKNRTRDLFRVRVQFYCKNEGKGAVLKGLQFLGLGFFGSVYEAHWEANQRSKTVTLKTEPPKTEPI